MNIKILKKDLKRKKSVNLILLVFIFLSTAFIAGSLNNFSVIQNGVDQFMELSDLADFIILTIDGDTGAASRKDEKIEKFLRNQKNVTEYDVDEVLYFTQKQTKRSDGTHLEQSETVIFSSIDGNKQKFFREDNSQLTEIQAGSIYISKKCMKKNNLKKGDALTICMENGFQKVYTVAGSFKDAFLGSEMMGTERMLVNQSDYEEVRREGGLPLGNIYSVNSNNLKEFEISYHNQELNVLFSADRGLVKTSYVMETVIAAVILSVSLCLIVIALVMLKFTIVFTVNEDYKEIGIMKAIGLRDSAIRRLYTVKYFVLASAGALLGFGASVPFSQILLRQATEKLVIEYGGTEILFQFLVSIGVLLLVTFFGYYSTGKIKRLTPMDAIRRGNNGERFQRKGVFHLKGSRMRATTFLACNDVACEFRKYLVLALTGMLGVWLVVMPVNTINTLRSDGLLEWFGTQDCDFFLVDENKTSELVLSGEKQAFYDYMESAEKRLEEHGIPVEQVYTEVFFRLKIRKEEKSYQSFSLQGLNTRMEDYFYEEGTAPVYDNEIAMTYVVAEKIGAGLGDTVYVTNQGREEPYLVTALYQSMNNMGEGIRFTEEAELDYAAAAGSFGIQVRLEDKSKERLSVLTKVERIFPEAKVQNVQEFIDHMVGGISQQLDALKLMILAVVLTINILVVSLMQRMFLIREQGEMGMLKAMGFQNRAIIVWQVKRILLVLSVGIAAGAVSGTYFSQATSGRVFQIMGATRIDFVVNPWEVYVIYPLSLLAAAVTACVLTMRRVRRISVQEINRAE